MMAIHLQEEISSLKRHILAQSTQVEACVEKAVQALERGDVNLARAVISQDDKINHAEVALEEECLKVLALHQPVATDLRFIISVIKINSDLERIADVAVNIAKRILMLDEEKAVEPPFDYKVMGQRVMRMFRSSLDALVDLDSRLARKVIRTDDEVDAIHRATYGLVKSKILEQPAHLNALMLWLAVSRHLERIADLSAHIAEDVVYMIDGEIVRHGWGS
ncbi:MAG: phosphate signaling complex protein PhoU [Desulfuromonadaceae bacterium]|nr:phosphate signaling complex protein PhoU [Desulfuromonadaceae bacterium]